MIPRAAYRALARRAAPPVALGFDRVPIDPRPAAAAQTLRASGMLLRAGVVFLDRSELVSPTEMLKSGQPRYAILFDPDALADIAPYFVGVPVTIDHKAGSVNNPTAPETIAGAIIDARMSGDEVRVDALIWDAGAIAGVKTGARAALSAGFKFSIDPMPGVWRGERYDGRATFLRADHVALLDTGRIAGASLYPGQTP